MIVTAKPNGFGLLEWLADVLALESASRSQLAKSYDFLVSANLNC